MFLEKNGEIDFIIDNWTPLLYERNQTDDFYGEKADTRLLWNLLIKSYFIAVNQYISRETY